MNGIELNRNVLVIGYGNPMRADDGIGWAVAERLAGTLENPNVEIVTTLQLMPELAHQLSECRVAIFIDASVEAGGSSITVRAQTAEEECAGPLAHHLTPGALLRMAGQLFGHQPKAYLVAVRGDCFDHGGGMSSSVETLIPLVTAGIEHLLAKCGCESKVMEACHA